jgi:DNA polymerase V
VSRSFGQLLSDRAPIEQALLRFVARAGEKLRREGGMAERLTVFARTDRINPAKPCYSRRLSATLPWPTDYTPELIGPALRLFERIFKPGLTFQKCGVMLTNLVTADRAKRDLFEDRDPARQLRLMRALDALNGDYGARTINFGNLGGPKPKALLRANFVSPRYTTSWNELRVVR